MYTSVLQPLLFALQAERAHRLTFAQLGLLQRLPLGMRLLRAMYGFEDERLVTEAFGLRFPNPIGLAAGMDKNAELLEVWQALGFGYAEVGTVTPKPQAGNPKPRLFRLPKDRALINRMGFNNAGMEAMARRLEKRRSDFIVGVNIGKNKATPNDAAWHDYVLCFDRLAHLADYVAVNVSSPNTPGLRELQGYDALERILSELQERNAGLTKRKPILLKIAPDMTPEALEDVVRLVEELHLPGVIATNTTIARAPLTTDQPTIEQMGEGGLSGAPLAKRSTEVVRTLTNAGVQVVGVGGIDTGQAAQDKFNAGASLIQLYSGLVYAGPGLLKTLKQSLLA